MTPVMSTRDAARLLGVNIATVRRWVRDGKIESVRLPGGQIRIPVDELARLTRPAA